MTHTGEQLLILEKFGLQYNPDCVVVGLFVGNDFVDAAPERKRIVVNGVCFDINRRYEIVLLGYPIVPKSRLYHFIKQKYAVTRELAKSRQTAETKADVSPHNETHFSLSEEKFLQLEMQRLQLFNTKKYQDGVYSDRIAYILQSISEMKRLLDSRDIRMVVCLFPDEFQVNESLLKQIYERYGLDEADYDVELLQKIMRKYLAQEGIPCVDLLEDFRAESRNRRLYLPRDTHWNSAGRELAAGVIYEHLNALIDSGFLTNPLPEAQKKE
jgi:hypothetical protein